MLKKGLHFLTVVSCVAMPMMAYAWSLTSRVNTGGGTLQVRSNAPQNPGSSVFKSYTTHQDVPVTITAGTGYMISTVQINGSYVSPLSTSNPQLYTMGLQQYPVTSQFISVWFSQVLVSVTVAAGPGGSVFPSKAANMPYGSTASYTFTPNTGYTVVDITGLPSGASVADAVNLAPVTLPGAINEAIKVTAPVSGFALMMSGIFSGVTPNAGAPQTVSPGTTVTLNGSGSVDNAGAGTLTYSWVQTEGPAALTLAGANTAKPVCTPVIAGLYKFTLTVSNGTSSRNAYTYVNVTESAAATARRLCQSCHQPNRIGALQDVFNGWSSSKHKINYVLCANCHVGTDNGNHPGPKVTDNVCRNCHLDNTGAVPNHLFAIGTNSCIFCHNPHSTSAGAYSNTQPHYNNITSGAYPASYLTSRIVCTNCHVPNPANAAIRQDWKQSGHAATTALAWTAYDFKTQSGCVQCHSTTGFIAYSTGKMTTAWGDAADKTKELLTCIGCHSDVSAGILRIVAPVRPFADDAGYLNPDTGKSNLCMNCHSGRKNGKSITVKLDALADFTNLPFIDPHYMATGGVIYAQAGYHFPGRSYSPAATHIKLGSTDGSGSCVSCHKNSSYGHQFKSGAISLCASCHGTSLTGTVLSSDKAAFLNALKVLRAQLAAKGFVTTDAAPGFSNTNWGAGQAGADTMGAAFNYVLLASEPGAYAHNPLYASQLVLDSIDYLDNGQFDNSVITLAVPNLLASSAITQAVADSMTSYKSKNGCTICHGGTAATATPMATNAHGAHLTGSYGPGSYLGNTIGSCQTCHVYGAATHLNGNVDLVSGTGSACVNCHAGLVPTWSGSGRLDCTACHAPVPSILPNGAAAPYKANFNSKGHGQFAASNQCTTCHDPDSRHISGSLGSYTRLRGLNDNNLCASCHSDPAKVGAANLNMSTHVSLDCRVCHDPHGTTNLSMIRTTINGTTISFVDRTNGFVDTGTNRGLCQGCHTATAHYRAGVPESGHYSSGCLGCHPHNSAAGAFKPAGGNCDSCHGYPPAPKVAAMAVPFGTMNNWSSARFEDYSGGGGAHLVMAHISPFAKASEGWVNCTMCHNSGKTGSAPQHQMILPVSSHIRNVTVAVDPQYRFDNSFNVYTAAKLLDKPARNVTGSCYNMSCHMSRSPRWSIER